MRPPINVKVAPLRELFDSSYRFRMPWFQRAYAWQLPQVGRLLTNIFEGLEEPAHRRFYMLGNLTLARTEDSMATAVVDGHQRILTITLLFAVLRDLETDPERRAALHARISSRSPHEDRMSYSYHVDPQASLVDFFDSLVQSPGATTAEPEGLHDVLSETERNLLENRDYLRAELSADTVTAETRRELASFLEDACHVVLRFVDSEDLAWNMQRVEEETATDFNQAARAKASLVGVMPVDERLEAARIWDSCQHDLGSRDTYRLLDHIRAIKLRSRSSASLEADICLHYELDKTGLEFMRNVFEPCAMRMKALRSGSVGKGDTNATLSRATELMVWINPDLWMPAAIHWMDKRGDSDPHTSRFFKLLERLVWLQKLAGIDPPRQENRITAMLDHIEAGQAPDDIPGLKVESSLRKEALAALRRVNFRRKHIAVNVLRRLSIELGDSPHIFDKSTAPTVEHLLPQSPNRNSDWRHSFPTAKIRKSYVNRLGNLTILTREENQAAANGEWGDKRETLKDSKFALSRAVAREHRWSPEVVDRRAHELIKILFDAWELTPPAAP